MKPELYYNVVKAEASDENHTFYVLVSEMPDKMHSNAWECAAIWGAVDEQMGHPNVAPGVWGKESVNMLRIRDIMEGLGIERSTQLKLNEKQRLI